MKKIYFAAISAALLMTASCSNEAVEPTDQATVQFSVNLDDIQSRAIGDGTTVDQLVFAVYDSEGNELTNLRQNDVTVADKQAQVTTTVARGQKYTFVFWAQKSGNTHYTTTDLKDVVVSYEGPANDETRDAFTNVYEVEKVTGPINETVTLYRPFAQLDYVCDLEEWTNLVNSNYKLVGSDLLVTAGAFTHINLLTGEVSQPTTEPFTLVMSNYYREHQSIGEFCGFVTTKDNAYHDLFTSQDGDKFWISMNYLLASKQQTVLEHANMNIYALINNDTTPVEIALDNIPIERNHRTVVYVSNLTKTVTTVIQIDPNFGGDIND